MIDVAATRVRAATTQDEDAVWPLARDLATSFAAEREAFGRSFRAVLADGAATVLVRPPTWLSFSNSVTWIPARAKSRAEAKPPGPAPTTATRRPVSARNPFPD